MNPAAVRVAAGMGIALATGLPLCPFASLTGVPCPGCGLFRAALALAHGDVREALALHPLVLVAIPLGLAASLHVATARPKGRAARRALAALSGALLVAVVGVWLGRFCGAFGGPVAVRSLWAALSK